MKGNLARIHLPHIYIYKDNVRVRMMIEIKCGAFSPFILSYMNIAHVHCSRFNFLRGTHTPSARLWPTPNLIYYLFMLCIVMWWARTQTHPLLNRIIALSNKWLVCLWNAHHNHLRCLHHVRTRTTRSAAAPVPCRQLIIIK